MLKEFKNGNLHIKLEKAELKHIINIEEIIFRNYKMDFLEEYYYDYKFGWDVKYDKGKNFYTITEDNLVDLANGKTIILKPYDNDYIEEYLEV